MEIDNNKESKLELPHNEVRTRESHIGSNTQQGMRTKDKAWERTM